MYHNISYEIVITLKTLRPVIQGKMASIWKRKITGLLNQGHSLTKVALITTFLMGNSILAGDEFSQYEEYEVKGVFIYNFLNFVTFSHSLGNIREQPKSSGPIIIVIGTDNPNIKLSKAIRGTMIKDRALKTTYFNKQDLLYKASLDECDVLFLCDDQIKHVEDIVKRLGSRKVLIIGESNNFLTKGGMINFLMAKKKIRFEINLYELKKAGFDINPQLLKLASKVITKQTKLTD